MKLNYGLSACTRKELVQALERITGEKRIYEGAPKFGYQIGTWYVDRDGCLIVPHANDQLQVLDRLKEEGFSPSGPDRLTITIPVDNWTATAQENLERLIASKAGLIKKALACDALDFERTDEGLSFPWFLLPDDPSVSMAYAHFISLLCKAAKTQSRVTAKDTPVENEKYAFRCFLLRLGMIGDEYKAVRKVLLSKLEGNSAFKTPKGSHYEG